MREMVVCIYIYSVYLIKKYSVYLIKIFYYNVPKILLIQLTAKKYPLKVVNIFAHKHHIRRHINVQKNTRMFK